jgi:hypothetical protein
MPDAARGVPFSEDACDVAATGSLRVTDRIIAATTPTTATVAASPAMAVTRVIRRADRG